MKKQLWSPESHVQSQSLSLKMQYKPSGSSKCQPLAPLWTCAQVWSATAPVTAAAGDPRRTSVKGVSTTIWLHGWKSNCGSGCKGQVKVVKRSAQKPLDVFSSPSLHPSSTQIFSQRNTSRKSPCTRTCQLAEPCWVRRSHTGFSDPTFQSAHSTSRAGFTETWLRTRCSDGDARIRTTHLNQSNQSRRLQLRSIQKIRMVAPCGQGPELDSAEMPLF